MRLDTFVKMVKMLIFHRKAGGLSLSLSLSPLSRYDHEISASVIATDLLDHSYEWYSKGDGYREYLVILRRH